VTSGGCGSGSSSTSRGLTPADSSNASPHSGQQSQLNPISRSGSGASRHSGSCPDFQPGVPPSVRGCSSSSSPPDEDDSSCFDWFLLGGVCGPSYHRTLALSRLFSLLIYFIEIESEINLSARNNWSYSIGTPSSYRGRYSRSPFSTWSLPFSTTTSPPTMVCVGSPVSFFP